MSQIDVISLFYQGVSKKSLIEIVYTSEKSDNANKTKGQKPTKKEAQKYVETELYRDSMKYK